MRRQVAVAGGGTAVALRTLPTEPSRPDFPLVQWTVGQRHCRAGQGQGGSVFELRTHCTVGQHS